MRHYGSFLVRWWELGPGRRQLNIRHVQSGEELTVGALAEAQAWMAARVAAPAHPSPEEAGVAPGQQGPGRGLAGGDGERP